MDLGIAGKWALVCGASQGLGLGCARALAAEGVNLVMVARGTQALELAATEIRAAHSASNSANSISVLTVAADITTAQGRLAAMGVPGGPANAFDLLVTNAGGPPPGDFRHWDRADWLQAIDANMLAPIELIKSTIDGMAARCFGRILNITSSAVKSPIDVLGLSNGARAGLTGFVAGLARQSAYAARGVTINNLLPGTFDTQRIATNFAAQAKLAGISTQAFQEQRLARHPMRRLGHPDEFGALCAFLCSQQAAYMTGQNLLIDGGSYPGVF